MKGWGGGRKKGGKGRENDGKQERDGREIKGRKNDRKGRD